MADFKVQFESEHSSMQTQFDGGINKEVGFGKTQPVNGKDGKDGVSPSVAIENIDGGHRVEITDKDGPKSFDVMNGKDGQNGKDGKDGYTPQKGVDYFDGYTPVKGTDYFTETEKAEMVAAVRAQLITEQWTFTLMDGSVVTKDVVVE